MAYDFYNAYLSTTSSSSQQYWQSSNDKLMEQKFSDSFDCFTIKKKNRTTGIYSDLTARVTAWISDKSTGKIHDDFKKLIFLPNTTFPVLGDIYEFESYRWMVVGTDNILSPTIDCVVQRCNVQVKFIPTAVGATPAPVMPTLSATPLVLDGIASNRLTDPMEDKIILMPNDMIMLRLSNDENARKIKYIGTKGGTRFLLGNPVTAWKTIAIDSISDVRPDISVTPSDANGILNFRLQSDTLNVLVDNLNQKVAMQYV